MNRPTIPAVGHDVLSGEVARDALDPGSLAVAEAASGKQAVECFQRRLLDVAQVDVHPSIETHRGSSGREGP